MKQKIINFLKYKILISNTNFKVNVVVVFFFLLKLQKCAFFFLINLVLASMVSQYPLQNL